MTDKNVLVMLNQPPSKCPLDRQLAMLEGVQEKGVLLIQDAVYYATSADGGRLLEAGAKVFALRPSVEARGIFDRLMEGVELVDYPKVVDLIMEEYDIVV